MFRPEAILFDSTTIPQFVVTKEKKFCFTGTCKLPVKTLRFYKELFVMQFPPNSSGRHNQCVSSDILVSPRYEISHLKLKINYSDIPKYKYLHIQKNPITGNRTRFAMPSAT